MTTAKRLAAALGDKVRVWQIGPGGIVIDINSDDPDTPAMVWDSVRKKRSSTYYCAVNEGTIDDQIPLSHNQQSWLIEFETQVDKAVDKAFEAARRDLPEYSKK